MSECESLKLTKASGGAVWNPQPHSPAGTASRCESHQHLDDVNTKMVRAAPPSLSTLRSRRRARSLFHFSAR